MNAACGWQLVKCRYTPHVHIVSPRSSRKRYIAQFFRWRFQKDAPSNGKCRAWRFTPQVKHQQTFRLPVFFARTCPLDHVDWTSESVQFLPSAVALAPPLPTRRASPTHRHVHIHVQACLCLYVCVPPPAASHTGRARGGGVKWVAH